MRMEALGFITILIVLWDEQGISHEAIEYTISKLRKEEEINYLFDLCMERAVPEEELMEIADSIKESREMERSER